MSTLEIIMSSLSPIVVAGLAAWQTRLTIQVKELKAKVAELEANHDALSVRFRIAIAHIREWMGWWRIKHPGTTPPALPAELRDEV